MRIIARIPDLAGATNAARGPDGPEPAAAGRKHDPRPRRRSGPLSTMADAGMSWPVAALAVAAAAAWMLASWNDHARLQRQRGEVRLAREAAAPNTRGSGEIRGALVR